MGMHEYERGYNDGHDVGYVQGKRDGMSLDEGDTIGAKILSLVEYLKDYCDQSPTMNNMVFEAIEAVFDVRVIKK